MSYYPLVPAIIPADLPALLAYAKTLTFAKEIQLDLVDGRFVESVSWPYDPVGEPMSVSAALAPYTLEVDLMVTEPLAVASEWIKAGADMLVFHVETLSLESFIQFAAHTTVSIGVSAHGATSLDTLSAYAAQADYIQLMGIYEIGAQGLPFDEAVLDKTRELKKRFPNMMISVDGSVNEHTITRLRDAGVDRFISGSAIVLQPDPEAAFKRLSALIND